MRLSTIAASLVLFLHVPTLVLAERLVRFVFNDGKDEPDSGECTTLDTDLIDNIFILSGYNETHARHLHSSVGSRGLKYHPPKCKKVCEGFPVGKCRASQCNGYRRELSGVDAPYYARDLINDAKSFSCSTQIDYINDELNNLVNSSLISSSCKKLLSKPRISDCYDDVIFGSVERMVLWHVNSNSGNRAIANSHYSGGNICKNTRVDFEPITNTCVDMLFSTVTGPNNFYKDSNRNENDDDDDDDEEEEEEEEETSIARTVFWNEDDDESGIVFPFLGAYTIKSVPDGFQDKALTIQFNVVTGTVEAVRLWDTTTKTIIDPDFTGGTVCRNKNFNFEVVLGACATRFRATLTGPSGYSRSTTDSRRPFSMFGDWNGVFNGRSLSTAGVYNFTIFPDQILSSETKSILFTVANC